MDFSPPQAHRRRPPRQRRTSSEEAIVAAFGRVLERDGVAGLGVNAVLREAGVGKKQLYDYFGSLEGVARRWCEQAAMSRASEAARSVVDDPRGGGPYARIARGMAGYAGSLRDDAASRQLLAAELAGPSVLSPALAELRERQAREHSCWARGDAKAEPDLEAVTLLLTAAASYLALRAACAPRFHDIDLDSEPGWGRVLGMFQRVGTLLERTSGARSPPPEQLTNRSRTP